MGQDGQVPAGRREDVGAWGLPRFGIAFQPIVELGSGAIIAHEALLRGPGGTPAGGVLARVPAAHRAGFEAEAARRILTRFDELGGAAPLHVNISPAVLLQRPGLLASLAALRDASPCPPPRLVIEVTEGERADDAAALARLVVAAHENGFGIALDDFGSGYGGAGMLAEVRPDAVKLDMRLIRGIHQHRIRRPIVARILEAASRLCIPVIAVGVESEAEFHGLADLGVLLFQGFLIAPPAAGRLVGPKEVMLPVRQDIPPRAGLVASGARAGGY